MNRTILATAVAAACAFTAMSVADTLEVPGRYPTIQAAIDAAAGGDEVLVAPGTYVGTIDFLGKSIDLRSTGGAGATILDGGGTAAPVVTIANVAGPARLEGFQVTGGAPGIAVATSTVSVIGCHVHDNTGLSFTGGGIDAKSSSLTVQQCIVSFNIGDEKFDLSGAGIRVDGGSLVAVDSSFDDNVLPLGNLGGGLYLHDCTASLTDCSIRRNRNTQEWGDRGGGLAAVGGMLTMTRCLVEDNFVSTNSKAGTTFGVGGGVYLNDTNALVSECTFTGNECSPGGSDSFWEEGGGAIYVDGGTVTVEDSAFRRNRVTLYFSALTAVSGGAIKVLDGTCSIARCLFDRNEALQHDWLGLAGPDGGRFHFSGTGGAIEIMTGAEVEISDCSFTRNEANGQFPAGGGVYGGSPTIGGSFFCANTPDDVDASWNDGGGNTFSDCSVEGDLTGDGNVSFADLLALLAAWGECPGPPSPCLADLNDDGMVGFADLLVLLTNWSPN